MVNPHPRLRQNNVTRYIKYAQSNSNNHNNIPKITFLIKYLCSNYRKLIDPLPELTTFTFFSYILLIFYYLFLLFIIC